MSYQGIQGPDYSISTRPITPAERKAAEGSLKPMRNNARGMAVVSILMAILVQFSYQQMVIVLPLLFGFVGLGYAFQARKGAVSLGKALSSGTVTDIRAVPRKAGRGWSFGPVALMMARGPSAQLREGVPASISVMPETKSLLSVDGVPLRKPIQIIIPPGTNLTAASQYQAPPGQQMSAPSTPTEDLPPPPDGWTGDLFCTKCGQKNPTGYVFCSKCGSKLAR